MDLAPDFRDLLEELARGSVEFVVVGGYAAAFHGRPRATKDIDVVLGSLSVLPLAAAQPLPWPAAEGVLRGSRCARADSRLL